MNKEYLIKMIEDYSKESTIPVEDVYKLLGEIYQNTYGVNIVRTAELEGCYNIVDYLDSKPGFIDKYVHILNLLKKMPLQILNVEKF